MTCDKNRNLQYQVVSLIADSIEINESETFDFYLQGRNRELRKI